MIKTYHRMTEKLLNYLSFSILKYKFLKLKKMLEIYFHYKSAYFKI